MLKDARGQEIKLGSLVAFPGRAGSSLWLTIGKVVGITTRERWDYNGYKNVPVLIIQPNNDVKKTRTEILHRVVVIQ